MNRSEKAAVGFGLLVSGLVAPIKVNSRDEAIAKVKSGCAQAICLSRW
jgi:hypothetical protein